jgi:hypothetical protein
VIAPGALAADQFDQIAVLRFPKTYAFTRILRRSKKFNSVFLLENALQGLKHLEAAGIHSIALLGFNQHDCLAGDAGLLSQLRACSGTIAANGGLRSDGVVPVAVKFVAKDVDGVHLVIGDFDACRIGVGINFGSHL